MVKTESRRMKNNGMTNSEAIKTIEVAIAEVEWNYPMEYAIAFEKAKEALELQMPKKLTHEATLLISATCPNCGNVLDEFMELFPGQPNVRIMPSYCHFCGQALDWSEYGK